MSDADSLMTPPEVYRAIEAAFGRPALDPCWHPRSPVRPLLAGLLMENFVGHKGVRRRTSPLLVDHPRIGLSQGPYTPDEWAGLWPYTMVRGYVYGYGEPRPRFGSGYVFLNPPYSRPGPWLRAAAAFGDMGLCTVALIKADPSTSWCNECVWHRSVSHLGFFRQRLRYGRTDGGKQYAANFPSALVVYGRWPGRPLDLDIKWVLTTTEARVTADGISARRPGLHRNSRGSRRDEPGEQLDLPDPGLSALSDRTGY